MEEIKNKLKLISTIEGISLIILIFVAMPLKYIWGYKIATIIMGSIHGVLWLSFLYVLFNAKEKLHIDNKTVFILIIYSVVPFGFIPMKKIIDNIK